MFHAWKTSYLIDIVPKITTLLYSEMYKHFQEIEDSTKDGFSFWEDFTQVDLS